MDLVKGGLSTPLPSAVRPEHRREARDGLVLQLLRLPHLPQRRLPHLLVLIAVSLNLVKEEVEATKGKKGGAKAAELSS